MRTRGSSALSIKQADWNTIKHDITRPFPLKDNTVDFFQAEDVLEHIPYEALPAVFAEIHRILKPGARFRLSVPDYRCDVYASRCQRDAQGRMSLTRTAAAGTGTESPAAGRTCGSPFSRASRPCAMQARSQRQNFITITTKRAIPSPAPIDYAFGYIDRTPDHDPRVQDPYRALSLVVDLIK